MVTRKSETNFLIFRGKQWTKSFDGLPRPFCVMLWCFASLSFSVMLWLPPFLSLKKANKKSATIAALSWVIWYLNIMLETQTLILRHSLGFSLTGLVISSILQTDGTTQLFHCKQRWKWNWEVISEGRAMANMTYMQFNYYIIKEDFYSRCTKYMSPCQSSKSLSWHFLSPVIGHCSSGRIYCWVSHWSE